MRGSRLSFHKIFDNHLFVEDKNQVWKSISLDSHQLTYIIYEKRGLGLACWAYFGHGRKCCRSWKLPQVSSSSSSKWRRCFHSPLHHLLPIDGYSVAIYGMEYG